MGFKIQKKGQIDIYECHREKKESRDWGSFFAGAFFLFIFLVIVGSASGG